MSERQSALGPHPGLLGQTKAAAPPIGSLFNNFPTINFRNQFCWGTALYHPHRGAFPELIPDTWCPAGGLLGKVSKAAQSMSVSRKEKTKGPGVLFPLAWSGPGGKACLYIYFIK